MAKKIKYYQLVSVDGNVLMSYNSRRQARKECKQYAYSGTCKELVVGRPDLTRDAFVW